jgi:hypothetical protein
MRDQAGVHQQGGDGGMGELARNQSSGWQHQLEDAIAALAVPQEGWPRSPGAAEASSSDMVSSGALQGLSDVAVSSSANTWLRMAGRRPPSTELAKKELPIEFDRLNTKESTFGADGLNEHCQDLRMETNFSCNRLRSCVAAISDHKLD